MKPFIISLFLAVLLCACSLSEKPDVTQFTLYSNSSLYQMIDSLERAYSIQVEQCGLIGKSLTARENEFTEQEQLRIAQADMEGFAEGAALGALLGGMYGSTVPAIGTAAGGVSGAVALGVAYAAVWSANAANAIRDERQEELSVENLYLIDSDNPIKNQSNMTFWFDNSIRGANAGFYHNYCLSQIYNQMGYDFWEQSLENIVDNVFDVFNQTPQVDIDFFNEVHMCARENIITMYDEDTIYNIYDAEELVHVYIRDFIVLPDNHRVQFTNDFMSIVNDILPDTTQIYTINGAISTFIYSWYLWNLNLPDKFQNQYICLNLSNNFECVSLTTPADFWQYNVMNPQYGFVAIPIVQGEDLIALVIYDEMFNLNLIDNSRIRYVEEVCYLYIFSNEELYVIDSQTNTRYTFPAGEYEMKKFRDGYLVVRNIEEI